MNYVKMTSLQFTSRKGKTMKAIFCTIAVLFSLCANAVAGQNSERVFDTKSGTFRVVISFGSYSTNPDSSSGGGMQHNTIQTPDGKWHMGFPLYFPRISDIVDVGDSTFIITSSGSSNDVVFYDYEGGEFHKKQTIRGYLGRSKFSYSGVTFYELWRDSGSDFAGLVYYVPGEGWTKTLISPNLDNLGWITGVKEESDGVFILYIGKIEIRFEPRQIGTELAFVPIGYERNK